MPILHDEVTHIWILINNQYKVRDLFIETLNPTSREIDGLSNKIILCYASNLAQILIYKNKVPEYARVDKKKEKDGIKKVIIVPVQRAEEYFTAITPYLAQLFKDIPLTRIITEYNRYAARSLNVKGEKVKKRTVKEDPPNKGYVTLDEIAKKYSIPLDMLDLYLLEVHEKGISLDKRSVDGNELYKLTLATKYKRWLFHTRKKVLSMKTGNHVNLDSRIKDESL